MLVRGFNAQTERTNSIFNTVGIEPLAAMYLN